MAGQVENSGFSHGRESQKNRTRKALIEAARRLMGAGQHPTVPEAAEAAGISRATAYRYFPTQEMLLAESVGLALLVVLMGVFTLRPVAAGLLPRGEPKHLDTPLRS